MTTIEELKKTFLPSIAPEDFFILLAHATKKDKVFLLTHPEYVVKSAPKRRLETYLARRLKHEPIAYITGHKEFYGFDFKVTPDTLIPRPETELLVEEALTLIKKELVDTPEKKITLADIGTGSGNIIITLAKTLTAPAPEMDTVRFSGVDTSAAALRIAKKNARRIKPKYPIIFRHGSLLLPLLHDVSESETLFILANLPYVAESLYEVTPADVRLYEPKTALVSEDNGLAHYSALLEMIFQNRKLLPKKINLLMEISPEQSLPLSERSISIFPQAHITILPDLAGKDRLVSISLAL